jgi:hypothetical protein
MGTGVVHLGSHWRRRSREFSVTGLMRAHDVDEQSEMVARRAAPSTWAAIGEDISVSFQWFPLSLAFRPIVDVGGDAHGGIGRGMAVLGGSLWLKALVGLAGRCVLLRFPLEYWMLFLFVPWLYEEPAAACSLWILFATLKPNIVPNQSGFI